MAKLAPAVTHVSVPRVPPFRAAPSCSRRLAHPVSPSRFQASSSDTLVSSPDHVHPIVVNIEHTDCFGMVFYGNYFRFMEEARESLFGGSSSLAAARRRIRLLSISSAKWAASARLGDVLRVRTTIISEESSTCDSGDGDERVVNLEQVVENTDGKTFMAASATCRVAHEDDSWNTNVVADEINDSKLDDADVDFSATVPYCVGTSDVDASGCINEVAVMRAFERGRTACLGVSSSTDDASNDASNGASTLMALQEAGVLVVVTRMKDFCYVGAPPRYGRELIAQTSCRTSAAGAKLDFHQWLECASTGATVARANVTCLCVGEDGRRKRLPI